MENQKPPSKATLLASLAFFGLLGFVLVVLGISSLGEDSESIWVIAIGLITILGTFLIAPFVFKGAEKQHLAYKKASNKKSKTHEEVHHSSSNGVGDLFSGVGSLLVIIVFLIIGFFIIKGGWNFAKDKFGPESYTAFFYYDPSNLNNYWQAEVSSIEDCRDWVDSQVSRDFDGRYDYECGVNCEYDLNFQGYICDKTLE